MRIVNPKGLMLNDTLLRSNFCTWPIDAGIDQPQGIDKSFKLCLDQSIHSWLYNLIKTN